MKITKNGYIILFIIFFTLLALFLNHTKVIEGFSPEYKYLEKLPDNNTWSKSTIDTFKNAMLNAPGPPGAPSRKPPQEAIDARVKEMQKTVSDEEALEFAKTGSWPWDDYVIKNARRPGRNNSNTSTPLTKEEISQFRQHTPNRAAYLDFVAPFTVASVKTLDRLGKYGPDSEYLYPNKKGGIACSRMQDGVTSFNTFTISDTNNNEFTLNPSTDYSLFAKYIPNFKFTGAPYDICESTNNFLEKPIKFEITGSPIPEAWNIYTGKTGASSKAPEKAGNPVPTQNIPVFNDFISLCKRAINPP
jgi:hypothetical protein